MKHSGNLTITLPSDREVALSRVFDAPSALVFEAYTKCAYLKRWLGAFGGWSLDVCEIDLRVGGAYRYLWHGKDGAVLGVRGTYREIVTGERIVATEKFDESWYDGDAFTTVTFVESGGRTTLMVTVTYATKRARDGVLQSGMTDGMTLGFDKLTDVLASMLLDDHSSGAHS